MNELETMDNNFPRTANSKVIYERNSTQTQPLEVAAKFVPVPDEVSKLHVKHDYTSVDH